MSMCSSCSTYKEDSSCYLMYEEVDKLHAMLEEIEKKIEIILSKTKNTLN